MEKLTMAEIAQAVGAAGGFAGEITELSTDSRNIPQGCLFVALAGEWFNGHDYLADALKNGAAFAVAHERRDYGSDNVLYVKNTQDALMAIGRLYRSKFQIHCVGITGSVGKTTTKDMIAEVVSSAFRTLKTEGNLNNEIGLPKTLFRLDPSYEAAVIEMGMQGLGEIAALAAVAQPQVGVITNIGVSHIERLGSRENILKAKLELADTLPDGAPLILCGDNDLLKTVRLPRLNVLLYGIENPDCTFLAKDIRENVTETSFILCYNSNRTPVSIPCVGRHNVLNALAACAVGTVLGIPPETCVGALKNYAPSGMRQKIVPFCGYTVVEDCYNASPDSMKAALSTLSAYPCGGRRVAVLGDMFELGEIAPQAHREVGEFAIKNDADFLFAYGKMARYYKQGAIDAGGESELYQDKDVLAAALKAYLRPGDVVWFKASRGMHLEEVLQSLYADAR
ncbi:UDP-N-acetylmuramoyl-tripeptide--D-alanyl-D-alanine ligase [Marasmitruncus massiliensis]|uniref:UDP-N-acetylmuramoyl-tripeptide--D-alanyl-D- alanine ligase n=1 Tax=Marasmitruncus massiliensis TaxID=1944642 RepID=UPI000C7BD13C|nr:UDP-N-acetylmuramoyl-tripeptide--D-alanyl-D-alanine ligase [Marasmitruncus massiliensis]